VIEHPGALATIKVLGEEGDNRLLKSFSDLHTYAVSVNIPLVLTNFGVPT
ncbi:hypothetical protein STEG23_020866, partial [Scotinomys teguina]